MAFVEYERVPSQLNRDAYNTSLNKTEPLCLVVNPRAGAGRAGARLDDLKRAADRAFAQWQVRLTEGPGHASLIAAEAVDQGFGIVAAVGGDGTCHEVVQGMVVDRKARSNRCAFTTIPFGTGSDLMKTLEIPRSLSEALWVVATGITLPTDVGRVTWGEAGSEAGSEVDGARQEYFINVAGFGANGEVVRRANRMDKRLGGRATFLLATVRATREYQGGRLALEWLDEDERPHQWEGEALACFVGNGAFCGGGMWVGRGGTMQDGLLDVTVLPPGPLHRRLGEARHLFDGQLERVRGAVRFQARSLSARSADGSEFPVDLDGEERSGLPVHVELLPAALQVRGGWISNPVRGDRGRQFG